MADRSTWVAGHGRPATHDVVVVGGGAAGLSAALVLGRARRRVAVIDAGAPRNAPAAHMQGFLSRDGMPPLELIAAGRDEVQSYGVEVIDDQALEIRAGLLRPSRGRRHAHGPPHPDRNRRHRRGPRHPRRARTVGQRLPALPVLPRLGSARPADRRPRNPGRLGAARAPRASVVRRRRRVQPYANSVCNRAPTARRA